MFSIPANKDQVYVKDEGISLIVYKHMPRVKLFENSGSEVSYKSSFSPIKLGLSFELFYRDRNCVVRQSK